MIKVPFEVSATETADSMGDFYEKVGVVEQYIHDFDYNDVMCYWMNADQCEELRDYIEKNAKKSKKYRRESAYRIKQMAAWDWLNYSPVADENIPRNELWIYTKDEAKTTLDEFRARKRKEKENGN